MIKSIALLVCFILGSGCHAEIDVEIEDECKMESIGVVTMNEDMSLTLLLRATDEDMTKIGDAIFFVKESDPMYQKIIEKIGAIKPGQTKDYLYSEKCSQL